MSLTQQIAELPIASTYAEYRKQKCEWCSKDFPYSVSLPVLYHLPNGLYASPRCTAPSRDTYEAELVARLVEAEEDTERLGTLFRLASKSAFGRVEIGFDIDEGGLWEVALPGMGHVDSYCDMNPRGAIDAARKGETS